ncbi:hypothetical protein GCM10027085_42480 [Spirosoma aerophilum]
MTQLMNELDVNSAELTQFARLGNDFWSSQLKLMPTFQRSIVMGLATIILTPSGSNINPNRYTPSLRYWANELNIDYLTMSHWMEAQGIKQINYLLARGYIPGEF